VVWVKCEKHAESAKSAEPTAPGDVVVGKDDDTNVTKVWNAKRNDCHSYSEQIMDDLASRYEAPDGRNRWDKPLYHVDTSVANSDLSGGVNGGDDEVVSSDQDKSSHADSVDESGAITTLSTSDDSAILNPIEQKADEILDSFLLHVKALKVGMSTHVPLPTASNVRCALIVLNRVLFVPVVYNFYFIV